MGQLLSSCYDCTRLVWKTLLPLTSLLTVGVVSYISYAYLTVYLPLLNSQAQANYQDVNWAYIFGIIFIPMPIYIFVSLGSIVFSDPGAMDKKKQNKILRDNGI